MSSKTLRDELSNDPLNRGYGSMSDSEVASDMNSTYRSRERDSMSGANVFNETTPLEFNNLTAEEKDTWLMVCGIESMDPFGPVIAIVSDLFGQNSQTMSNLTDARTQEISRSRELGLNRVKAYDVNKAREQLGES